MIRNNFLNAGCHYYTKEYPKKTEMSTGDIRDSIFISTILLYSLY